MRLQELPVGSVFRFDLAQVYKASRKLAERQLNLLHGACVVVGQSSAFGLTTVAPRLDLRVKVDFLGGTEVHVITVATPKPLQLGREDGI